MYFLYNIGVYQAAVKYLNLKMHGASSMFSVSTQDKHKNKQPCVITFLRPLEASLLGLRFLDHLNQASKDSILFPMGEKTQNSHKTVIMVKYIYC
jgi:hypothetical protein